MNTKINDFINTLSDKNVYLIKSLWMELDEKEKDLSKKIINEMDIEESVLIGMKILDKKIYEEIFMSNNNFKDVDLKEIEKKIKESIVGGVKKIISISEEMDEIKKDYVSEFLKHKAVLLKNHKEELQSLGFNSSEVLVLLKEASNQIRPAYDIFEKNIETLTRDKN